MEFLIELLVLLLVAKVLGEIFHRYGFSSLIGEVMAGVILGPAIFGLISKSAQIEALATLGLIIMMLASGMSSRFDVLARVRFKSFVISLAGVCVSLLLGTGAGYLCTGNLLGAVFIGAVLSNTATEIVARFTARSHLYHVVTAAALVDDILAVYVLGITSTITLKQKLGLPADVGVILWTTVGIVAFFLSVAYLSQKLVVKFDVMKHLWRSRGRGIPVTFAIVLAMVFAVIARYIGLHEIIGAYVAGLFIGRLRERPDALLLSRIRLNALLDDMSTVLQAVLTPFFFAYIGLLFPALLGVNLFIVLALLAAAIAGKTLGSATAASAVGYNGRDSVKIGAAMCARGSLELAMIQFGKETGLLSAEIYPAMVVAILITAVLAPIMFRLMK
ncbi:MAG: cation:proton antiporter [Candidatus Hadarchaeales archaeon]